MYKFSETNLVKSELFFKQTRSFLYILRKKRRFRHLAAPILRIRFASFFKIEAQNQRTEKKRPAKRERQ